MGEKKEKQWAVLLINKAGTVMCIRWWDARKDARKNAEHYNSNPKAAFHARVFPMQRGAGA